MMESMTGHGRGTASAEGWRCTVECSSVNRKGTEIAAALPKPLATLEPRVREEIQKHIRRGRVNATIALEAVTAGTVSAGVGKCSRPNSSPFKLDTHAQSCG